MLVLGPRSTNVVNTNNGYGQKAWSRARSNRTDSMRRDRIGYETEGQEYYSVVGVAGYLFRVPCPGVSGGPRSSGPRCDGLKNGHAVDCKSVAPRALVFFLVFCDYRRIYCRRRLRKRPVDDRVGDRRTFTQL